jgi:hypothetical protein
MLRNLLIALVLAYPVFGEGPGPAGGHATMRLGVDAGTHQTLGAAVALNYRFGLHDFLDRQTSYPVYTQLDIFSIRLEAFPQQNRVLLDELTLVRFIRLPPLTRSWEELSWKLEIGGRSLRDASCLYCGAGTVLAGLGATVQPVDSWPVAFWFLVEGELVAIPSLGGFPVKPAFGPRVGLRLALAPWLNGMIYAAYRYQTSSNTTEVVQAGTEWRLAFDANWAVNLKAQWLSDGWQGFTGLLAYF